MRKLATTIILVSICLFLVLVLLQPHDTWASGVDDSYTKALLHFEGIAAAQTFVDESGKLWAANDNAQISTAQPKIGQASAIFDGSGDSLSTPNSNDFNFRSGNFTIDFYFKSTQSAQYATLLSNEANVGTVVGYTVLLNNASANSGDIAFYGVGLGAANGLATSTGGYNDGNWHHFALVRSGNDFMMFVDGTLSSSISDTNALTDSSGTMYIGINATFVGRDYEGSVDEFRISKGIARWVTDFVPANTPYEPVIVNGVDDTYTKTLLHFEGSDLSTEFIDESARVWSVVGDTKISTALSKFNLASGAFDGSGDYLTSPDSADFDFAGGDFTIDAWVYPQNDYSNDGRIIISKSTGNFSGWCFFIRSAGQLMFIWENNWAVHESISTVPLNQWSHVAVVRHGDNYNYYINGQDAGGSFTSNIPVIGSSTEERIGSWSYSEGYNFSGNIDELRVSKGVARWSAAFATPTKAYQSNTTVPGVDDTHSKALLHLNGIDTSTDFVDESNKVWTVVGDPHISTSQSKFGEAAAKSSTGYVYAISDDFKAGMTDFTVDMWVYPTNNDTEQVLFDLLVPDGNGARGDAVVLVLQTDGKLNLFSGGGYKTASVSTLPLNSWSHVAVVRTTGTFEYYIDGILDSNINTFDVDIQSGALTLFRAADAPTAYFTGYMDEVRYSDIARWTGNFIPQASQYIPLITSSLTPTATASSTVAPTDTVIPTDTAIPTNTPTAIPTATPTSTPTRTPTNTPTNTIRPTNTPIPTATSVILNTAASSTPTTTIILTQTPTLKPTTMVSTTLIINLPETGASDNETRTVIVHVVRPGGGDLANAVVEFNGIQYTTNAKGEFSLQDPANGTYELKVKVDDKEYTQSLVFGTSNQKDTITVELNEPTTSPLTYALAIAVGIGVSGILVYLIFSKRSI
jgi:hypothetical protein